jgi:fucose permease
VGGRLAGPTRPVLALGFIAFCGLLAEGAMADWAAIWLFDSLGTSAAVAACGFATFSLAMAAGRLAGDHLVAQWGVASVLRASGSFAAVTLGLALLIGHPVAALAGSVGLGLGLANVVPIVFRAAAQVPGLPPGYGLAATTTVGYCGLIAGPPFIGLVAAATSLPLALGLVVLASAAVALFATALPTQGRPNVFPKKLPGFQRGGSGSDATA